MSLTDRDATGTVVLPAPTTLRVLTTREPALRAVLARSRSGLQTRHVSLVITPTCLTIVPVTPLGRATGPAIEEVRPKDVHFCSLWGRPADDAEYWARHGRADHLVLHTDRGRHRWFVLASMAAPDASADTALADGVEALYHWLVDTTPGPT